MPSVVVRWRTQDDQADALVAEIRPIALSFQAKHPLTGLPAITDLAADEASGPFAAARSEGYASRVKEIPANCGSVPQPPMPQCRSRSSCRLSEAEPERRSLGPALGCRCRSGGHDNCREADSGG